MRVALAVVALFAFHGGLLYFMGQPLIYEGGFVKLWHGVVLSAENSQHLTDWYTLSHVIHGILFYALFTVLFPRMPLSYRLLMSVTLEAGWELIENSSWIIDRYREQALAQGYFGDSIINSLGDAAAAVVGFFAASQFRVWVTILLAIILEGIALYAIRDNLTLNVIQIIYPLEWLGAWQSA